MEQVFDVAVIGGGINGCGVAADAALRGLSVILLEKDDLASKTSSSSSKLIHGGLRYLEQYDFGLVKKALNERQLLLTLAPHLVHPLPFVLPYEAHMRSRWLLRTGLFFYDNLSRNNTLPHSKTINRGEAPGYFNPLTKQYTQGFLFYDCATDDSRLTIANALQAKAHGAHIVRNAEVENAEVIQNCWQLGVKTNAQHRLIKAKSLINAAGPWASLLNKRLQLPEQFKMTLVKGSHLVVHKLYEGSHAYLLQNSDQRIVFIVPYHGYTMIGTTDVAFTSSLDDIAISSEEVDYLCNLVNQYLQCTIQKKDIINTWSGVRPLLGGTDGTLSTLSRDYLCNYTSLPAPAVTIYGGKITTYRQSSLEAVNHLHSVFPTLKPSLSSRTPLPGALFDGLTFREYLKFAREKYFWLGETLLERYLASYGTRTEQLLLGMSNTDNLGQDFGAGLFQREVDFLVQEEWAMSAEDILWRRSKLGLHFSPEKTARLAQYLGVVESV
ncbi:MAG: glycerol-3-phosphate dehydrogenase [Tatlockia sp.]|jgi:glycerol-3-phosphate dehydrogenase